jgi:flagellar protein FlaF
MYKKSYARIIEDSGEQARAREYEAFDKVIDLLELASLDGIHSRACVDALYFLNGLWMILLEDISRDDNALPLELRRRITSIGIWVLKQTEDIRLGRSADLRSLIEINTIIRDGLR